MFWQNYQQLCWAAGKGTTALAVELGFSNATATGWRNGAMPRPAGLKKIADYFGITVEELLADNEKPATADGDGIKERLSKLDPDLLQLFSDFLVLAQENPETAKRHLSFAVQELQSSLKGH